MGRYSTWEDVERAQKVNWRRNIIKFLRRFKKYILPFIISLILFFVLHFIFTDFVGRTNSNYILSSITQGLASLVALLFVIIFFLCQSTGRVSMLSQVLKPDGYLLLGTFVVSIIFPLIILKVGYTHFLINLSISMCAFCLASLFPFIISVNETTKKFGICNIIVKLESTELPRDNIKYGELIDDLKNIDAKQIIKLTSHELIGALIKILNGAIKSEISFINQVFSMRILASIGTFSMIEKEGRTGHFYDVKQIISELLFENCSITKDKSKQLFARALAGISNVLFKLKLHEKLDSDIRLYFAEVLMDSSFEIFNKLKDIREREKGSSGKQIMRIISTVEENQGKLEGVILDYLRRKIILVEDFQKVYKEYFAPFRHKRNEGFRKYIKDLLNANE